MTVASEISRIKTNISNAYDSAEAKGATLPEQKNSENLAECIDSITGGGGDIYFGFSVDQSGKLVLQRTGDIVFSGFSDVGRYAFANMFEGSLSILPADLTSADLSNLTTISGNQACNSMFSGCESLTSVNLSSLKSITGANACSYMFSGCLLFTSINLSNLETITGSNSCAFMFSECESLTSLSFPSLKRILSPNAFFNIVGWCSGVTMHFPSNMESTIAGLTTYPNFGGTNTTLLFDLPPTA